MSCKLWITLLITAVEQETLLFVLSLQVSEQNLRYEVTGTALIDDWRSLTFGRTNILLSYVWNRKNGRLSLWHNIHPWSMFVLRTVATKPHKMACYFNFKLHQSTFHWLLFAQATCCCQDGVSKTSGLLCIAGSVLITSPTNELYPECLASSWNRLMTDSILRQTDK
jgi:hypothetical protein